MRVFVLCTGRCGSTTLARAGEHLTNYTAGHETRANRIGDDRFDYPDQHVEVDNRLSWFLGDLDRRFGDDPLYVHLRRDPETVATSFTHRWGKGIIGAFDGGIVFGSKPPDRAMDMCRFYVDTVTANIESFLRGRPRQMTVWLEDAPSWLPDLWTRIGGEGNLQAAMDEFNVHHNATT